MFGGEAQRVSIWFENKLLDTVIERFGTGANVMYRPEGDSGFVVTTEVEISPLFFAWICGFGSKAKISTPIVAEQFAAYLSEIQDMYDF